MLEAVMGVIIDLHDTGFWSDNTFKDFAAPIVRRGADGKREGILATYGMVPQAHIPKGGQEVRHHECTLGNSC